jgi:hypothetical protein
LIKHNENCTHIYYDDAAAVVVMVVMVVVVVVVVVVVIHTAAVVFVFASTVKHVHQNMVLFAADANYQITQIPVAF